MHMTLGSVAVKLARIGVLGRFPVAPGTFATTIAGLPCALLLGRMSTASACFLILLLIVFSCYVSSLAEKELGRHDPGEIVIDELSGYLVAIAFLPSTMKTLLIGLVLFRVFDIWKPWPIRVIDQRVQGGIGVVLDDVIAGVFANVSSRIILSLWSG